MKDKNPKFEDKNPEVGGKKPKVEDKNPKDWDKNPKMEGTKVPNVRTIISTTNVTDSKCCG